MSVPILPGTVKNFVSDVKAEPHLNSQWDALYRDGLFDKALSLIEANLESNPASLGDRLGWVLVQLEIEQVPLKTLSTPLTEILPQLTPNSPLAAAAICALIILSDKLAQRNQLKLGSGLILELVKLSAIDSALSPTERESISAYSKDYLHSELKRAEEKKENPEYLAKIKHAIDTLPVQKVENKKESSSAKRDKAKRQLFDSRSIADASESSSMDMQTIEPGRASKPESSRRQSWMVGLITIILFCLLFGFYRYGFLDRSLSLLHLDNLSRQNPRLELAMQIDNFPHTSPGLPDPAPNSHEKLTQKILSLNGNIEQVGAKIKELNNKSTDTSAEGKGSDTEQNSSAAQTLSTPTPLGGIKPRGDEEIVPLDSDSSKSGLAKEAATNKSHTQPAAIDPRKLPRLESKRLGTIVIENVDRPEQTPFRPHVDRPLDAITPSTEPKALDGSPLRAYEVDQLQQPVFYRTLVSTTVLSAPSVVAERVTRLEPNTKIRVVARLGQWLELRSSEGRRGFIYAQDAQEVKD